MEGTKSVQVQIGRGTITLESGLMAKQAQGAVSVRLGDTIVFSATTISKQPREGIDWFPLQVEYREKFYAAGRFPGGYFKREARPSEKEILTARATDRPIRPLFPEGFKRDVQIYNTLLSSDGINDSDVLCMNAASASLMLTEAPFEGPVGAVRVGRVSGEFIINPTHEEMDKSDLNLIYVATRDLPMMIEGDAQEVAEADIVAAMKAAHGEVIKLIDAQLELRRQMGLPEKRNEAPAIDESVYQKVAAEIGSDLESVLFIQGKKEREARFDEVREAVIAKLAGEDGELEASAVKKAFEQLEIDIVRRNVLEKKRRIDGRGMHDLRPISGQVALLPRTHGSGLFTRGETQALATVTLGTQSDAQSMDAITGGPDEKSFMLHYNFPPYSVGEAGRIMGPGRREIGHGNLAERSLRQVMPREYPYTVRVVSEIMESNGSSSMASICAGTLALMDAGVPITKPVAGISIGLFTGADGKRELVTDIIGSEDHCGDMDFKVAGTRDGITGFQVDLKLHGLAWEAVEAAFEAAREARLKILDAMAGVIAEPRPDIAAHAPRVQVMTIPTDKIGALIGPGGKNIRRITDMHDVQIDIDDDGTVHIFATNKENMAAAVTEVEALTKEAEIGTIYKGTVKSVKDFGAFVEILPGKEGLVHISEMANFRVRAVEDICKVGDTMWVKCIDIDNTGRIRLSRRAAMEEMDEKEGGE